MIALSPRELDRARFPLSGRYDWIKAILAKPRPAAAAHTVAAAAAGDGPERRVRTAAPVNAYRGPPMTLGNAAAAQVRFIVWCGARRMTYAELATVRGISPASARRLARRDHWPRQVGNDGILRVVVPLGQVRTGLRPASVKGSETVRFDGQATPMPRPMGQGLCQSRMVRGQIRWPRSSIA